MKRGLLFIAILPMLWLSSDAFAQRCRRGTCGGGNGTINNPRRGGNRPDMGERRRRNRDNNGGVVRRRDLNRDRNGGVINPRPRPRRDRDVRDSGQVNRRRRVLRNWDINRAQTRHQTYRHRPNWNRPGSIFTRHRHIPDRNYRMHTRRYLRRYEYHRTIPYRFIYWNRWIRHRTSYSDGYYWYNDYPYFVYNGYQHRYSNYDLCDYELVDGYSNTVVRSFSSYTCATGYDLCADLRDDLNYERNNYRYFCSERVDNSVSYDWDYNDDFYNDVNHDWDDDYYYDDYNDDYYYDNY